MLVALTKAAWAAALAFVVAFGVFLALQTASSKRAKTLQQNTIGEQRNPDKKTAKNNNDGILIKIVSILDKHSGLVGAIGTLFVAIFTGVLVLATIALFSSSEKVAEASRKAAEAAKQSADVAERALVAVERPIIIVSFPEKYSIAIGRPRFLIDIGNAGKQVAIADGISIFLLIQKDSNYPDYEALRPHIMDGSMCTTIPFIGEIVIRPSDKTTIKCQRQRPITADEAEDVVADRSYAFFKVGMIYLDSTGRNRTFDWAGLLRPSGKIIQVGSTDTINDKILTPEQQENDQRVLTDTLLSIERQRGFPFPDE
jgi:hypothetical protein